MTDTNETDAAGSPEVGWLGATLALPGVGSWVALVLLLVPVVPLMLILAATGLVDLEANDFGGRSTWFAMTIVGAATLGWLVFLRRATGVQLTFYFVPLIWLAWAFTTLSIAGIIFGF